ncbi:MAG: ATP-dependent helicase, partial [Bacillota bacterium]|nr:ATP-dependent helicase [Bacillota bacterium]
MSLRKGQKELVEQYRGGFCAVPAIPGGGKTHCLAVWTAEMISNGYHKPGKILIVTYMNSAVNNFKKRIAEELKNRGLDSKNDYFVTTIHGLCLQIVREKPDIASISDEFNVIDDIERNDLINRSVLEWRKKNQERFEFFIESSQLSSSKKAESLDNRWQNDFSTVILSAIGDFKCRGISPAEAIEKTHRLNSNSIIKCAAEIYALYDQKLKIAGYLDFNDMLYNAKKMLATDSLLLESYRKKFSFVCEDEAQDSNMIQSEILNLIANRNLLRVGDSNQAICGSFSSSDFTLFKDFCNTPQTRVFNITQSSRSSVQIINLANYFVDYVRNNHPVTRCRESLLMQHIEPVSPYDDRPNPVIDEKGLGSAIFRSWEEEAANIADFSRRMLQKHPDLSTAILIPTAWKMKLVAEILESKGIPFEQLDNSSAERNKALRKLGSIIGFAVKPDSSDRFALMLKECFFDSSYEIQENLTHKKNILEFIKKCPVEQLMYPS